MEIRALNRILIFFFFHLLLVEYFFFDNIWFSLLHCPTCSIYLLLHRMGYSSICTCWMIASQTSITLGNKLRSKRSQNELTESSETICARFTVPFDNQTFFSPIDTTMLTDNYPPKISCTLKLQGSYSMVLWFNYMK